MTQRSIDIATLFPDLDTDPSLPRASAGGATLASSLVNFFRRNERATSPSSSAAEVEFAASQAEEREAAVQASLFRHWNAIKAEGISASQFIAFLQPLADLDGIMVSYISSDDDGDECLYTTGRNETGLKSQGEAFYR